MRHIQLLLAISLCLFCSQRSQGEALGRVFDSSALSALYNAFLIKQSIQPKMVQWSVERLDVKDLNAIPEASGPLLPYYNQSIIWAKNSNGKVLFGFRPVDTVTGCTSGCTPVVFHLVIDEKGQVKAILEEPGKPLRKAWHEPLTDKDKKILLQMAIQLPEKLEFVNLPTELTDSRGAFPPQTWTFFQDTLVPGGAYTSYAVYHTALITYQYLNKDYAKEYKVSQENQEIAYLFQQDLDSEEKIVSLVKQIKALFDKGLTTASKKHLLKYILLLVDYDLKIHQQAYLSPVTKTKKLKFISDILNTYSEFYSQYYQSLFCDFLMELLVKPGGAEAVSYLSTHYHGWKQLPSYMNVYVPFLSASLLGQKDQLKMMWQNLDKEGMLHFVSTQSSLLESYVYACLSIEAYDNAAQAFFRLQIRYPKRGSKGTPNWPNKILKQVASYKANELTIYTKELAKEFEKTGKTMPSVDGLSVFQATSQKTVSIPIKNKTKQIYLFFAPWCAHCFELVKFLSENAPIAFWEKVQLVSIFSKGIEKKEIESFCETSGLKKKVPNAFGDLIMLEETEQVRAFYKEMNLFAAPKVVILNDKGEVINFSYQFDLNPEKDFVRDLELVFKQFS